MEPSHFRGFLELAPKDGKYIVLRGGVEIARFNDLKLAEQFVQLMNVELVKTWNDK
jgi:hypothetical protein